MVWTTLSISTRVVALVLFASYQLYWFWGLDNCPGCCHYSVLLCSGTVASFRFTKSLFESIFFSIITGVGSSFTMFVALYFDVYFYYYLLYWFIIFIENMVMVSIMVSVEF